MFVITMNLKDKYEIVSIQQVEKLMESIINNEHNSQGSCTIVAIDEYIKLTKSIKQQYNIQKVYLDDLNCFQDTDLNDIELYDFDLNPVLPKNVSYYAFADKPSAKLFFANYIHPKVVKRALEG